MLGVNVRRPVTGKPPSRSTSAFRRRVVIGSLVVLALVLITVSFRKPDDGPVASAQSAAAAVLRPFTIAGERVAQPFRDVYAWGDSLLTARSDAKKLREENAALRQQAVQNQFAANENDKLKALLAFRDGPRFPSDYTGLAAAVIARPTGGFAQDVVVAVGSNDGVALDAPVVTEDGFLGRVTRVYSRSARVTLLTDEQLAVSALDVKTAASGIVKHGRASASTLIFDRVPKKLKVSVGRHDRHRRLALEQARLALSARDPDRSRDERRPGGHRPLEAGPGGAVRRLRPRRRGPRAGEEGPDAVSALSGVKIAVLLFVVAILQVSAFSSIRIGGAAPDVLLVTLVVGRAAARIDRGRRRRVPRRPRRRHHDARDARADLAPPHARRLLGRTLRRDDRPRACPCASRRDRRRTVFVELGGYFLDSLLGGPVDVRSVLLALPAAVIWNGLLAYPVFGLVRRLVGTTERVERAREVELLV